VATTTVATATAIVAAPCPVIAAATQWWCRYLPGLVLALLVVLVVVLVVVMLVVMLVMLVVLVMLWRLRLPALKLLQWRRVPAGPRSLL
jgi:hypothetical protein